MKLPRRAPSADRRLLGDDGTRAMTWIMAIMLFLTVLAGALGLGTSSAATLLGRQLAGRLTVQIVEPAKAARDAQTAAAMSALRASADVAAARPVDRAQLAALIRPWLGSDGADPDLPMPALIDVDLRSGDDMSVSRVAAAVGAVAPAARIDRHESWMSPVTDFMATLTWLAAGVVALMASATAAVVILAARAGLETHRDTIQVLHMLGSTDVQITRLFQRRIALDTLIGGVGGAILAGAAVALIGMRIAGLGSGLLDGLSLAPRDWIALALLPAAFALLATLAARVTVLRALRRLL